MNKRYYKLTVLIIISSLVPNIVFSEVLSQKLLDEKVKEMVTYIQGAQQFNGSYSYLFKFRVGATALALLSLRTAGVPEDNPTVKNAVNYIVKNRSKNTYEEGMVLLALEKMSSKKYKSRMTYAVTFLQNGQGKNGGWGYFSAGGNDESCSQYAVLGLIAAERCGFNIKEQIKERARRFFRNTQKSDGGWSYRQGPVSTLSMTCAGLSSLALLGEKVEKVLPECGAYLENKRLIKGLKFLANKIPDFMRLRRSERWRYYALYGLERTGIFLQLKNIGGWDWYKMGCLNILSDNHWKRNVVDASFALLFITKNDAPYVITKWKWRGDWNNDHYDVANWVESVSDFVKKPLDWQTAELSDGLGTAARSSMIFVNGHGKFKASHVELAAIRQFLAAGGILVGEACCGRSRFAESFRRVMENKLFQGKNLKFKRVPAGHPILSNVYNISSKRSGLMILGHGCSRKQVFLLKKDISCSYNGDEIDDIKNKMAKALGLNIAMYALGKRKPQKKFEEIKIKEDDLIDVLAAKAKAGKGTVFKYENPFGRIKFDGEWNTDPNFYTNLHDFLTKEQLPAFDGEVVIDPETDDVFACPVLFVSGHGEPKFTKRALINLRRYIQNGGFIMIESCCSDKEFNKGIKRIFRTMFPSRPLQRIPKKDSLYSYPYDLKKMRIKATKAYRAKRGDREWPYLYGISDSGRWAVIYSPVDYTCAVEDDLEEDIKGLKLESALPLIANIICSGMRLNSTDQLRVKK